MRTSRLLVAAILLAAGTAPAQAAGSTAPAAVVRRVAAMGTVLGLEVWGPDRATALRASEAAVRAVENTEARLSTWRADSELARANRAPAGLPVLLGADTLNELRAAFDLARLSRRAFDPAAGPLVDAWDLRGCGARPGAQRLAWARCASGPGAFAIGPGVILRGHPGARLEEGGFGKGAALDRARTALLAAGASAAVLDFGGQSALCGATGSRWIAVCHPRQRSRPVAWLRLDRGQSAATSGNGERLAVVDGAALGHLLDPRTGQPAADRGSVTAIATEGLRADAASTALFVLGPEATAAAAARLTVEALWVELAGGGSLRVLATAGLVGRVRAPDQRVVFLPVPEVGAVLPAHPRQP